MGVNVNTASKVDTDSDSEQLEFTTIFEKHTIEDEDSDVPVKFSELAKKDELYDVITSLETDFNLDLVEMFLIRHESYIFMTAWSCSRRLVPNLQVRINFNRYLRLNYSCTGSLLLKMPSPTWTRIFEIFTLCSSLLN